MKNLKNKTVGSNKTQPFAPNVELSAEYLAVRAIDYLLDRGIFFLLLVLLIIGSILLQVERPSLNSAIEDYFLIIIIYALLNFAYYFISESLMSRTPAKFITQAQVLTQNGNKPSIGSIFIRSISRAIPFNIFSPFMLKGKTFHDATSNTIVVRSKYAPEHLKIKKVANVIGIVIVSTFALLPLFVFFGYSSYIELTGGSRIYVPNSMPTDLSIVSAERFSDNDNDFVLIKYSGSNRAIHASWQIAGFNFDPDEGCTLMTSANLGIGYRKIDPSIMCNELIGYTQDGEVSGGWSVLNKTDPSTLDTKTVYTKPAVGDYWLSKPPHRLVIKAINGELLESEVIEMYNSGYSEHTLGQLQEQITDK